MLIDSVDLKGNLPKVNGKVISSNRMLINLTAAVLREIGYTFDPIKRPIPAFLRNFDCVDRKYLVRFIRNIVNQLRAGLDLPLDAYILSHDGFTIKYPDTGRLVRVCVIKYTYNGHVSKHCIPISELSYRVNKLLSLGVRQIEIA